MKRLRWLVGIVLVFLLIAATVQAAEPPKPDPKVVETVAALENQITDIETELAALKAKLAELKALLGIDTAVAGTPTASDTTSGYSRSAPASVGATLTVKVSKILESYTAELTLLETVRGDKAWEKVQAANMFNDPAPTGKEYLLAKFRFKLLEMGKKDARHDVSTVHFTAVSSAGADYDVALTVPPSPSMSAGLYQGASHEGWVVFLVDKTDTDPLVAYGRDYQGAGGIWFRSK